MWYNGVYTVTTRSTMDQHTTQTIYNIPVPASQRHHNIQRCEEHGKVKERVIVWDTISLVIPDNLTRLVRVTSIGSTWATHYSTSTVSSQLNSSSTSNSCTSSGNCWRPPGPKIYLLQTVGGYMPFCQLTNNIKAMTGMYIIRTTTRSCQTQKRWWYRCNRYYCDKVDMFDHH